MNEQGTNPSTGEDYVLSSIVYQLLSSNLWGSHLTGTLYDQEAFTTAMWHS